MKLAPLFALLGLFGGLLTACGDDSDDDDKVSDAELICQKFDDCNILEGISYDDCVERVDTGLSSAKRDCADCVDGKSCTTLGNGSCEAECASL